jgi:hypothetical protein
MACPQPLRSSAQIWTLSGQQVVTQSSAALSGAHPAALSNSAVGGGVLCAKFDEAQLPASKSDVESADGQRAKDSI